MATTPVLPGAGTKEVAIRAQLVLFFGLAELAAIAVVLRYQPNSHAFYHVGIAAAALVLLIVMLLGQRAVIQDIQEICLYDLLVQVAGLVLYSHRFSPDYYLTLAQALLLLKLLRLLWGINQTAPPWQGAWPVFGVLGALRQQGASQPTPLAAKRRIYAAMFCTLPLGYVLLQLYYVLQIPLISTSLVLIVAGVLIRTFRHFDRTEAAQLDALRAQAALAAQLAAQKRQLAEQNAELAAYSEERARHAHALAVRNAQLRTASHDLANRMMSVQAIMRRAQGLMTDPAQQACLQELQAQQQQFLVALDDIIVQARVEAPAAAPVMARVACSTIRDDIWEATEELAARHGAVLHSSAPTWMILTDAMQLERIVYNLLGNAIRHNRPGTHVGLTMRRHQQACQIRIWDNGAGIAGMNGRHWHDNFTRFALLCLAKTHHDDNASHGVGIQSVVQLCAGLGITMTMYSRIGRGTVFRFRVPLAPSGVPSEASHSGTS